MLDGKKSLTEFIPECRHQDRNATPIAAWDKDHEANDQHGHELCRNLEEEFRHDVQGAHDGKGKENHDDGHDDVANPAPTPAPATRPPEQVDDGQDKADDRPDLVEQLDRAFICQYCHVPVVVLLMRVRDNTSR